MGENLPSYLNLLHYSTPGERLNAVSFKWRDKYPPPAHPPPQKAQNVSLEMRSNTGIIFRILSNKGFRT